MQMELRFLRNMKKRKMEYAGHVLRDLSGLASSTDIRGTGGGKEKVGRTRRTWMDDILKWTGLESHGEVKKQRRRDRDGNSWLSTFVNEDDR
jgi:hypothetical protein